MRLFLIFLAVIAGLYLWQKHHSTATAQTAAAPIKTPAISETRSAPTPPQQVSEHNWMKRSLDRATEVRNQSRAQTRDAQNP